jgi:hypothetical protein
LESILFRFFCQLEEHCLRSRRACVRSPTPRSMGARIAGSLTSDLRRVRLSDGESPRRDREAGLRKPCARCCGSHRLAHDSTRITALITQRAASNTVLVFVAFVFFHPGSRRSCRRSSSVMHQTPSAKRGTGDARYSTVEPRAALSVQRAQRDVQSTPRRAAAMQ